MDFKLDLNKNIDERIELFVKQLLTKQGTFYTSDYFKNLSEDKKKRYDRLENHYNLGKTHREAKVTAHFGFKEESDLHYTFKQECFDLFDQHFPDGVWSSLVGYPQFMGRRLVIS